MLARATFARFSAAGLIAFSFVTHAQDKSRILFTLLTPIKVTEGVADKSVTVDLEGRESTQAAALGDAVQVDTSKADLELKLWKVKDTYNFESIINVKGVNQSMLPTDDHGRILKEARSLTDRPFIRYFLPGKEPITIDINCNRKQCRALWPHVPYQPVNMHTFQVEVNIRGLRGKHWSAGYNQGVFASQPTFTFPPEKGLPARVSFFNPGIEWPNSQLTPLQRDEMRVESVENWTFAPKITTGFRKVRNLTRFGLTKGKMTFEITAGEYLEKRDLVENQVLWLLPGQIIKLTNSSTEAQAIRVEFVSNSN